MPFIVLDPSTAAAAPVTTIGAPKTSVGKTLSSMRSELQLMLGGRGDIVPSRLDNWINDAYIDVVTSLKLDELKASLLFNTVAGQPFYLLPSVVFSTQALSVVDTSLTTGGQPLSKTDRESYRALPNESERPSSYFREGDMLVLYPTPDKAYPLALDFRIRPIRMTTDTHSPIVGEEWHRPILLSARQKAFDDLLEFDKALPAGNSEVNAIRRRTDREASEDENRVVRSSVPGRGERYRYAPWSD